MTAYHSFSTQELHSTECGGTRAAWRREGAEIRVMFVDDPSSDRPALRWPDEPMPAVGPGHIAFDPSRYPALAEVREMLPEYAPLWDAVADDCRDAVAPTYAPGSVGAQHQEFFSLPY